MVGGRVVEVILLEESVWVSCQDTVHPKDEPTAVHVERNEESEQIAVGDKLWWHGRSAFWTTPDLRRVDHEFERLSGSGVGRPAGY